MPERQEGHLLKKRKWPLKGWHKVRRQGKGRGRMGTPDGDVWGCRGVQSVCASEETSVWLLSPHILSSLAPGPCPFWATSQRYFVLEDGILHYATTRQDVSQGLGWGMREDFGPRVPCAGRGLLESPRAGSESQGHQLLGVGSWAGYFPGPQLLTSTMERVQPPVYRVFVLVRALRTVPGIK